MEKIREIKLNPALVQKIQDLAKRCDIQPNDENLEFLFEYLVNVSLSQIESIENFMQSINHH